MEVEITSVPQKINGAWGFYVRGMESGKTLFHNFVWANTQKAAKEKAIEKYHAGDFESEK